MAKRTLTEAVDRAMSGRWVEDFEEIFTNEFGRRITIRISQSGWNVKVIMEGPDSTVENIITPIEALRLKQGLEKALVNRIPGR